MQLDRYPVIHVKQRMEIAELFSFETRNKYEISTDADGPIGFAAEQQKGIFGFFLRQVFGHWRRFDIQIFNNQRQPFLTATHPFRFFFQRLEVFEPSGKRIGALQQRFAIFTKKFDLEDALGNPVMTVRSPIWKIWTFPFVKNGREVAKILKKWSGILTELYTDKDNFTIEYLDASLSLTERKMLLAAAIFVDLQYFEKKANNKNNN